MHAGETDHRVEQAEDIGWVDRNTRIEGGVKLC